MLVQKYFTGFSHQLFLLQKMKFPIKDFFSKCDQISCAMLVNLRQIASNKYSESAKRPQIIKAEQYSGKTI